MRLQLADGYPVDLPAGSIADVAVHCREVRDMVSDDGAVALAPFEDLREAVTLVDARYDALKRAEPALARNLSPSDAATLAECQAAGSLFAMVADGHTVGLIATLGGALDWLEGEVVMEEIVSTDHAGQGHAAAGQRALGARYAREDARRLLIGTIDAANVASSRSAVRAGRPVVSRYWFVPLAANA